MTKRWPEKKLTVGEKQCMEKEDEILCSQWPEMLANDTMGGVRKPTIARYACERLDQYFVTASRYL